MFGCVLSKKVANYHKWRRVANQGNSSNVPGWNW